MTGSYPPPSPQQPEPFPQQPPAGFEAPPQPPYGPPPPQHGQPQYGPPQYGPPQYGPPQYGPAPQFGPPGFGKPAGKSNRGLVIGLLAGVAVLLVLCLGGIAGAWFYFGKDDGDTPTGDDIAGVIDYRTEHPEWLVRDHKPDGEKIDYPMTPPAGGAHHQRWQRCLGDVYTKPIPNGNAVHSLEHGAVWVTYQPGLAAAEVEKLAAKVRGNDFTMMSPYEGQPTKVSVQAWGYQLRVSSVDDERIEEFLRAHRQTATMEPGATCSTGTTSTDGG